jgi:hypothetical protein
MVKSAKEIQAELQAYLAGKTEKDLNVSDNRLLASNNRSQEWYEKTAKRNKENAENLEIRLKISEKTKGRKINPESAKKAVETRKKNGNTQAWNKGISSSLETRKKLSAVNLGKTISEEVKTKISHAQLNLTDEQKLKKALGNKGKNRRPLITPKGVFPSQEDAAIFYNVSTQTIRSRRDKFPKEYYFISREEYIMLTGKDI